MKKVLQFQIEVKYFLGDIFYNTACVICIAFFLSSYHLPLD
jgi:hypothetical protein